MTKKGLHCLLDIERIFADVMVITCINLCVSNK